MISMKIFNTTIAKPHVERLTEHSDKLHIFLICWSIVNYFICIIPEKTAQQKVSKK